MWARGGESSLCQATRVRRRKAVESRIEQAAPKSGDDLGAGAIHPRPPTASVNTRQIWMSIHTIVPLKQGVTGFMPLVLLNN